MSIYSDFTVTLYSNASKDIYPENTASHFSNKLADVIRLPPVKNWWEVAVKLVFLPSKMYNIKPGSDTFVLSEGVEGTELITDENDRIYRPPYALNVGGLDHAGFENPTTIRNFINMINARVPEAYVKDFNVEYVHNEHAIHFKVSRDMIIRFPNNAANLEVFVQTLKMPEGKLGKDIKNDVIIRLHGAKSVDRADVNLDSKVTIILTGFAHRQRGTSRRRIIDRKETEVKLKTGFFNDSKLLTDHINSMIPPKFNKKIKLAYLTTKAVRIEPKTNLFGMKFTDELGDILGFKRNKWYNEKTVSPIPIDLDHRTGIYQIYIPGLIRSQYIGDTKGPLIYEISAQKSLITRSIKYENTHLQYYPVAPSEFQVIRVLILNDHGEFVPFANQSQAVIKLHFRPKILDH